MPTQSKPLRYLLNSGDSIPALGLGSVGFAVPRNVITDAMLHAIKIGYRHIDTASSYGSEPAIGDALSRAFSSGIVKREEMFITSKLWCDDHDTEDVIPALRRSLKKLQLDHLDLYLMHFPVKLKKGTKLPPKEEEILPVDIQSTWREMEKCISLGLAKSIGVSNFSIKKLTDLLSYATITPAVDQVEMHPVWQQRRLREFCSSKGIHVSAWSPLAAPGTYYGTTEVIHHPVINAIARKLGKTPAQVALRWGVQNGASVLPKSFNPSRIEENFDVFGWDLSEQHMRDLQEISQRRTNTCWFFCNATNGPYKTLQDLWDDES
ncbi:hypothetical protein SELMODRAFT_231610 [Selaginella moellendorffii]|uniref:NADP-dependent oxidoreductase domain-containing protein n=1 Tax=Selaginella moellendorffii TaxID=88036 RepID=D8RH27_SELML|nr:NADPH-dependent aldo-keto reductase, chloroplastic [Selaginella moellendorffii]EFJ28696.1 hypothetical protein SELMODRAFT_231610 [Selaginella moellendorffii]|eukprot:XP_002970566.1 NADPH-dependent aldo-keto reductase, chloroplastic [Selaginella moellendorffii]